MAGQKTGCCPNKVSCIEEKQRVRQTAVGYTQKSKQKNTCIHIHTHTYTRMVQRAFDVRSNSCHIHSYVKQLSHTLIRTDTHIYTLTQAHPHKYTHHGTHVICVIFWKTSDGTDVIPLKERCSPPPSVGQEPVRTRGAPA